MNHGMQSVRIAGVDLGDVSSHVCILDAETGEVMEESRIRTRSGDVERYFTRAEPMRVVIETGTHSAWVSRAITAAGHDVTVANSARVRLIHGSRWKNDRLDAEKLARLLRYDRTLLAPVEHRGRDAQLALAILRSRDALVRSRTLLINHVRGVVKAFGLRIPKCDTKAFTRRAGEHIPPDLLPALQSQLDVIAQLTNQIGLLEARIRELCRTTYPETACAHASSRRSGAHRPHFRPDPREPVAVRTQPRRRRLPRTHPGPEAIRRQQSQPAHHQDRRPNHAATAGAVRATHPRQARHRQRPQTARRTHHAHRHEGRQTTRRRRRRPQARRSPPLPVDHRRGVRTPPEQLPRHTHRLDVTLPSR